MLAKNGLDQQSYQESLLGKPVLMLNDRTKYRWHLMMQQPTNPSIAIKIKCPDLIHGFFDDNS